MPVVSTGLQFYYHAKDGIKNTNQFLNIAPGGPVAAMTFTGGSYNAADGSLALVAGQGMDIPVSGTAAAIRTAGAFTAEYLFTTTQDHTDNGYHPVFEAAGYFDLDDSIPGMYITLFRGTTRVDNTVTATEVTTPKLLHYLCAYDGSTIKWFVNGVLKKTVTGQTGLAFAQSTLTSIEVNKAREKTGINHRFHAFRWYNRMLTDAEALQNWNNGIEIGFGVPEVVIGVYRVKNPNGSFTDIPVYDLVNHPTEKLRIRTTDGTGYMKLVATTDANASRIRVRVGGVTMALRK